MPINPSATMDQSLPLLTGGWAASGPTARVRDCGGESGTGAASIPALKMDA
jgi:hypothetical protein